MAKLIKTEFKKMNMALDPNLFWAFVSIAVTYIIFSIELLLETFNPENKNVKCFRRVFGIGIGVMGLIIIARLWGLF